MKELVLKRIASTNEETYGVLLDDGLPFVVTLEPPDKGNKSDISCIPAGHYTCRRQFYNRGNYTTFVITGVPNRYDILFHKGNTTADTAGCILLAESFDAAWTKHGWLWGILYSHKGFSEFMQRLKNEEEFSLLILDYTPDCLYKMDVSGGSDILNVWRR